MIFLRPVTLKALRWFRCNECKFEASLCSLSYPSSLIRQNWKFLSHITYCVFEKPFHTLFDTLIRSIFCENDFHLACFSSLCRLITVSPLWLIDSPLIFLGWMQGRNENIPSSYWTLWENVEVDCNRKVFADKESCFSKYFLFIRLLLFTTWEFYLFYLFVNMTTILPTHFSVLAFLFSQSWLTNLLVRIIFIGYLYSEFRKGRTCFDY